MSQLLRVRHRTEYHYDGEVSFGPHRLMLRPRDGHDLWVEDARLAIRPRADLRWSFDPFGNSVAVASFAKPATSLTVTSTLMLRRYSAALRRGGFTSPTAFFPFVYDAEEAIDLQPFRLQQHPGELPELTAWLDATFLSRPAAAVAFLGDLASTINRAMRYSARDELGTQTAAETIRAGQGTCRDFAFLFMEAARSFGFAARFVTGYLHDVLAGGGRAVGGGATHAWADVYIPGEGWIEFDPTNRIVAGAALIRVAATRTPAQASPISGTFIGQGARLRELKVSVAVTVQEDVAASP